MKKFIITFIAIAFLSAKAFAYDYDFSYTYQGQTLYYTIVNGNAEVTYQNTSSPRYTNLTGTLTIPSSVTYNGTTYAVTSIGSYAFQNYSGLTSLTIGNSVTSIGSYAFQSCSGLTSVTIGNSVTSIGSYAFQGCSGLTIVNFNATNCTNMGSYDCPVFSGCTNLATLIIGANVNQIPHYAFKNFSGLTSVTVGNSVDSIGVNAFYNCSNLTTVNFNADSCNYSGYESGNSLYLPFGSTCTALTTVNIGSNVKALPDYIFAYCTNLTNINLPDSLKYIGKYALSNTAISGSITIPNSVTRINHAAFWRCYNITNITLPNTLSDIGTAAFMNDTSLVSINLPISLTHIRKNLFRRCYHLSSVDLSHVTKIDSTAFQACETFNTLTIPSCVTEIAYAAFATCTGITEITFEGRTPPIIGDSAFINIPSTVPVYIPCGTLALYAARLPYMNNFVEETFTFSAVSEDENKGSVQVLNEPTCTNPNAVLNAVPTNGYRFDHWSTGSTSNPYSLTVTTDTIITAYFVSEGPQMFTISTAVNDPLMGSVTGGGEYAEGSTVTLTAVPNSGYTFALWLDGNTNNPRTITVTEDATYTAVFQESNGIIDVDGNNIHIYVEGGNIRINGIENEKVQVFDMVGRPVGTQSLPTGVYMVRVGTFPARRVVVIR